jgi:capsular polysaccharide biosynthesis protein/Mrp family chromosome partitioning ATPase
MNSSTKPDSPELADYGAMLRRRWWVVVVLALLGIAAAAVAVKVTAKSYTATASVYVSRLSTDSGRPLQGAGGPVNLDNEAQIVRSQAVAELAAKRLRASLSAQRLAGRVTVTVPPNTTVLDIACRAPTAVGSAACANAFAAAYLAVRLSAAESIVTGAIAGLQSKADLITRKIGTLNGQHFRRRSSPASKFIRKIEIRAESNQLSAVLSRVNVLTAELATLQAPDSTLAGQVINPAAPPRSPSSPKTTLLLTSGLVGGLIVGLLAAFFMDARDERLRAAADVERFLDIPVLSSLRREQVGAIAEPASAGSPRAQAFAELAESIVAAGDGGLLLLVAGASPDAGVSFVAANLAAVLSQLQPDVLLVCAAPASSVTQQVLGVEHHRRPAELRAGDATIDDVAQTVANVANLRVIGLGTNDDGTLSRGDVDVRSRLKVDLRSQARYVIVEAPLTIGSSEALSLTELAGAAIIVIETSSTKRSDAKAWVRRLERLRVPVLGAVVVPRLTGAARPRSRLARLIPRRDGQPEPAGAVGGPAQTAVLPEQQGAQ